MNELKKEKNMEIFFQEFALGRENVFISSCSLTIRGNGFMLEITFLHPEPKHKEPATWHDFGL